MTTQRGQVYKGLSLLMGRGVIVAQRSTQKPKLNSVQEEGGGPHVPQMTTYNGGWEREREKEKEKKESSNKKRGSSHVHFPVFSFVTPVRFHDTEIQMDKSFFKTLLIRLCLATHFVG